MKSYALGPDTASAKPAAGSGSTRFRAKRRGMKTLSPEQRRKASAIGHSDCAFFCPLSGARADDLIGRLQIPSGGLALDIGCGRAGLLRRLLTLRSDLRGVGVDIDAVALAQARALADADGIGNRLELRTEDAAAAGPGTDRLDAVMCVGASHAVGGFAALAALAARRLAPGGVLLVGEGFWRRAPDPAYLAALGAQPDELVTHAANAERLAEAGLTLLFTEASSEAEWDDYEGRYLAAKVRWARANPGDPDAPAILASAQDWHAAYLRWGRETLGFGWYAAIA